MRWVMFKVRVLRVLQWLKVCPECGTRPDRHWHSAAPRWDQDKTASMLGAVEGRCGRCAAKR